jgi:formylglycine-generating enzyme required for sulfatase activity
MGKGGGDMGAMTKSWRIRAGIAALCLAFTGCPATDLRNYISSIVGNARMALPITLIDIDSTGDSFTMGELFNGPNVMQTISYSYRISTYEITKAQFGQFIATGGYRAEGCWTTNGWSRRTSRAWTCPFDWTDEDFGSSEPIVGVSWYEAAAFCNWRSLKDGLTPAYDSAGLAALGASGYRLPTEVEWEYAAAKGAHGLAEREYAFGDAWDSSKVVCSVAPSSATGPADVGSRSPGGDTPQGAADMNGNVEEWCSDNWQADAEVVSAIDRYYFANDLDRSFVRRGGGWSGTNENQYRCADRMGDSAIMQYAYRGFRVVRR